MVFKRYELKDRNLHKMRSLFILLFVMVLFTNCERDPKTPDMLTDKQYIDLLIDIHLAEGIKNNGITKDSIVYGSIQLYKAVLRKHKVTDDAMVKTSLYYSRHQKEFNKLYDEVLSKLDEMKGKPLDVKKIELKK